MAKSWKTPGKQGGRDQRESLVLRVVEPGSRFFARPGFRSASGKIIESRPHRPSKVRGGSVTPSDIGSGTGSQPGGRPVPWLVEQFRDRLIIGDAADGFAEQRRDRETTNLVGLGGTWIGHDGISNHQFFQL